MVKSLYAVILETPESYVKELVRADSIQEAQEKAEARWSKKINIIGINLLWHKEKGKI